ncbi:MAG: Crp/Fnr family transcriptional regulator [Sulfuricellaceae bacterium]
MISHERPSNDQNADGSHASKPGGMQHTPSRFLTRLSSADRAALVALATPLCVPRRGSVFTTGGPGKHVYFLESGKVKICQPSPSGSEIILWFCLPGEIFGLAEVSHGGGRVVSAYACEESQVLVLSQKDFFSFLGAHPDAVLLSMQALSSRLRVLGEMVVNLISDDANTRIAKLLLRLAARYGKRVDGYILLDVPLTHEEIANMVGTTRQTVTTVIGQFRRQGVLSTESRRIQIESEELLTEISLASTPTARQRLR